MIEHLPNPAQFFAECSRVLRPGGYFCFRTPNAFSYFGLASRLVPNRLHGAVLKSAQPNRKEEDVFPTVYRCNTVWKLRRALRQKGFEHCVYGYEAEPSYLSFSRLAYALGVLHVRFAPRVLKPVIFGFARKVA